MAKRLFVAGLSDNASEETIKAIFAPVGAVESVTVITDRMSGRPRFAFVEMEKDEDAQKAIQTLNDQPHDGRNLIVNEARPREENRPRPGGFDRGGRGFGGGDRRNRY